MTYAQKLKKLRIDRGYTQAAIADILKTSQQYYGKYENGIRPLTVDHLVTLCKFYHISADWLLGLEE